MLADRAARGSAPELHCGVADDFRPALKAHPGNAGADVDGLARTVEASGA